jgi:hypothetical protein
MSRAGILLHARRAVVAQLHVAPPGTIPASSSLPGRGEPTDLGELDGTVAVGEQIERSPTPIASSWTGSPTSSARTWTRRTWSTLSAMSAVVTIEVSSTSTSAKAGPDERPPRRILSDEGSLAVTRRGLDDLATGDLALLDGLHAEHAADDRSQLLPTGSFENRDYPVTPGRAYIGARRR